MFGTASGWQVAAELANIEIGRLLSYPYSGSYRSGWIDMMARERELCEQEYVRLTQRGMVEVWPQEWETLNGYA